MIHSKDTSLPGKNIVNIIRRFHEDMKARVKFIGSLSETFTVENRANQGGLMHLPSLQCSVVLSHSFERLFT